MLTVRYWAAAKAAAGVAEEQVEGRTLAEVLASARLRHDARFTEVLARCAYVVDGAPVGGRPHDSVLVVDGGLVDCLPPFAGG